MNITWSTLRTARDVKAYDRPRISFLNSWDAPPFFQDKVYQPPQTKNITDGDLLHHARGALWAESLFLPLRIPWQGLKPAVTMADSGRVNETAAAAANGDQQVRNNVTHNETHYEAEQFYEVIWSSEIHVGKPQWRRGKMCFVFLSFFFFTKPSFFFSHLECCVPGDQFTSG